MTRTPAPFFWPFLVAAFCLAYFRPIISVAESETVTRPNFLIVVTDDQRPDTIGALGNPVIRTPTLDRLVREGLAFTGAIAPNQVAYRERRVLQCNFLTDDDRERYVSQFWLPYAKTGSKIRYIADKTQPDDYEERHLFGDSLSTLAPTRLPGYPYFDLTIETKLWKA